MEMRRFDVWVGRIAAVAGIGYVLLASLCPLAASAEDGNAHDVLPLQAIVARDEATIGMLPMAAAIFDVRIVRVIAEVVARRARDEGPGSKKSRRRSFACVASKTEADRSCDEASFASSLPDASTTTILAIPIGAVVIAAAATLLGRGIVIASP